MNRKKISAFIAIWLCSAVFTVFATENVLPSENVNGNAVGTNDVSATLKNTETRKIVSANASGYPGKIGEVESDSKSKTANATGTVVPQYVSFSLTLYGEIAKIGVGGGNGEVELESYSVTRMEKGSIYIEAENYGTAIITVPFGETVTFYAKDSEGAHVDGDWCVSKDGIAPQEKKNCKSITFNRFFWGDIVSWFTDDGSVNSPTPGIYAITVSPAGQTLPTAVGTMTVFNLEITLKEADFTGGNHVPVKEYNTSGLPLVLNDDFDGMLENSQRTPLPDNSDNEINSHNGSKKNDIKDLGLISFQQLPTGISSEINKIFISSKGEGKIRLFHADGANALFWDSKNAMTDDQASNLFDCLRENAKAFYIEGYGEPGDLELVFSLNNTSANDQILQRIKIRLIKATRWLVTHDPILEKKVKASTGRGKQAELQANKAVFHYNVRNGNSYKFKLIKSRLFGSDEFIEAFQDGNGNFEFRLTNSNSTTDGALTDNDGKIYLVGPDTGKVLEVSPGTYDVKLFEVGTGEDGEDKLLVTYPLQIGPLLTGLSLGPDILSKKSESTTEFLSLDPYTDSVDVKWDYHLGAVSNLSWLLGNWVGIDEDGFGLEIKYKLEGDLKLDDSNGTTSTSFIQFAAGSGGELGGVHPLITDLPLLTKTSWWNLLNYSIKWEGFDASINENAINIYKNFPAENKGNGQWGCPTHVAKEGTYKMKINAVYRYDETQVQKIEIDFDVKYKLE